MRKFRGGHEDPGRRDARPPRRRGRWVLTGGLLAGGLVVGAAGLAGVGPTSGAGNLAGFDVGRLTSIVTSPDHDKDGKGPKEKGPHDEDSAGRSDQPTGNGPGEHDGEYGRDGCEPDDHGGERWSDKDDKGAPLGENAAEGEKRSGGHHDDWNSRCGSEYEGRHHKVLLVPCDADELIAALVRANAVGGATLKLAPKCTYTLTAYDKHEGRYEDHDGRDDAWGGDGGHAAPDGTGPGSGNGHSNDNGNGSGDGDGDGVDGVGGRAKERSGLPLIHQPIRIKGEGATITRPAHAEEFRFFTVRDGGELKLSDLTLENGRAAEGGSIKVEFGGVAVLERTKITQSTADSPHGGGGAIFNDGNVTLVESKLTENSAAGAAGRGGGILNGGVLAVKKSEFTDNSANGYGGGLANFRATADVSRSDFAHNTAAEGGAIASFSSRTRAWDSKIAHNTAKSGGGIAIKDGTLNVRQVKIVDNIGLGDGGGIATAGGLVVVNDSLVKANTTFGNGGGVFATKSNVVIRETEVVGNDAVGRRSVAGGIFLVEGKLTLFRSKVTENEATREPGGIFAKKAKVEVDEKTVIIRNRPTNCEGSPVEIPNCFG